MPTDAEILQTVQQAFAACTRPEHFTNFTHCEECAEHDAVLRSRDRETLLVDDVEHPGWNPICFATPEGFAYYLPALVRLALAEPVPPHGWYGGQLLFQLCYDGRQNHRLLACTPAQRQAITDFLLHLVETRSALAESECCTDVLTQAFEIWSETLPNSPAPA